MFTTVRHHWVKEGLLDAALETFGKATEIAKKEKGFVSRHILVSVTDPIKVLTLTTWETRKDLEAWSRSPNRHGLLSAAPPRFERIETDIFGVVKTEVTEAQ